MTQEKTERGTEMSEEIKGEQKMTRIIKASINRKYVNKEEVTLHKNRSFTKFEGTIKELADVINQGHTFCTRLKDGSRCEKNFESADFIVLDFDGGISLEEIRNNEFIKEHAGMIYTTPNHKKDGKDRFRLILPLEGTIKDIKEYKKLIKIILNMFTAADQTCSDGTRFYFGSKNSNPEILNGYLSKEVVKELIDSYIEPVPIATILNDDYKFSKEDIREMLTYIHKEAGYQIWRNISWAVQEVLGEDAKEGIEEWSPDFKHEGKHLKDLLRKGLSGNDDKRITVRTLLWYASKNGYKMTKNEFSPTNAGHVVLKHLFNDGVGYITIAGELYEYVED
ncbi:MAG: hypothetical protein PHV37_01065 [Candidatus Gastranaerophilales bacterium]|nr:hypothetical protein [Candidatus Gastranaerophilales bacterium]